jgi:signal transduction histidine kinase
MRRAMVEREQLLVSERNARAEAERLGHLKDEFLATLSHELRTPLTAIMGWATLLRRHPALPAAQVAAAVDTIYRNAKAQAQIIEDLLDMSRIVSGKFRLQTDALHGDFQQPLLIVTERAEPFQLAHEVFGLAAHARALPLAVIKFFNRHPRTKPRS